MSAAVLFGVIAVAAGAGVMAALPGLVVGAAVSEHVMVAGVALMMGGIVWWLVVGALVDRWKSPAPLSGRALVGYGLYALGVVLVMAGLSAVEQASGWAVAAAGLGIALVMVAAGVVALLLALVLRRSVRRGRQGGRRVAGLQWRRRSGTASGG